MILDCNKTRKKTPICDESTSQNYTSLKKNNVHLWKIPLDEFNNIEKSYNVLSKDEQQRAKWFQSLQSYQQYILCRSATRRIIASYLNIKPEEIVIRYTKYQKPYIFYPLVNLNFNVAHSSELAICAITIGSEIGVDLEAIKYLEKLDELAEIILTEKEYGRFLSISANKKLDVFYIIWTRKESYVKALGKGLNYPLKEIEVLSLPQNFSKMVSIYQDSKLWNIQSFSLNYKKENYQGAYSIEGNSSKVIYYAYKF